MGRITQVFLELARATARALTPENRGRGLSKRETKRILQKHALKSERKILP